MLTSIKNRNPPNKAFKQIRLVSRLITLSKARTKDEWKAYLIVVHRIVASLRRAKRAPFPHPPPREARARAYPPQPSPAGDTKAYRGLTRVLSPECRPPRHLTKPNTIHPAPRPFVDRRGAGVRERGGPRASAAPKGRGPARSPHTGTGPRSSCPEKPRVAASTF